jgi:hypothetical protein
LSGGAIEDALAVRAKLTGRAFICTRATVIEIGFGIDADTGTIGETGGAEALRVCTDLTTSAFSATGTAVIGVGFGIDAGAGTSGLSSGAIEDTYTIGAELTG